MLLLLVLCHKTMAKFTRHFSYMSCFIKIPYFCTTICTISRVELCSIYLIPDECYAKYSHVPCLENKTTSNYLVYSSLKNSFLLVART